MTTSTKSAALNGAAPAALNDPPALVAEAINAALEGQPESAIIQTLTALLAGHIVYAADGNKDATTELVGVTCRNIETFTDHLATQHRLAIFRQSLQ